MRTLTLTLALTLTLTLYPNPNPNPNPAAGSGASWRDAELVHAAPTGARVAWREVGE